MGTSKSSDFLIESGANRKGTYVIIYCFFGVTLCNLVLLRSTALGMFVPHVSPQVPHCSTPDSIYPSVPQM